MEEHECRQIENISDLKLSVFGHNGIRDTVIKLKTQFWFIIILLLGQLGALIWNIVLYKK